METTTPTTEGGEYVIPKANTGHIWRTFWILAAITTLEFIIAFTVINPEAHAFRVIVFITLTLVKAAYIVAEFMHLKYEAKTLMWSILIPLMFICWLLGALYIEGESIFAVR
jgi:cytochrome c oxidase subunit IV